MDLLFLSAPGSHLFFHPLRDVIPDCLLGPCGGVGMVAPYKTCRMLKIPEPYSQIQPGKDHPRAAHPRWHLFFIPSGRTLLEAGSSTFQICFSWSYFFLLRAGGRIWRRTRDGNLQIKFACPKAKAEAKAKAKAEAKA